VLLADFNDTLSQWHRKTVTLVTLECAVLAFRSQRGFGLTSTELVLLKTLSPIAVKSVMAAFRARPFPRKVISALKEHGSDGKLTFRQARAMRALLRRDETWHLLVDARQHSDEQLAELVSTDVFREPGISSRSRLVAAWVRAATPGALSSEARANFVISNVRDVGDDVAAGNRKLSQVGDQVNEIHSMVSSKPVFVDPEVLVQGPLVALGLDPDRKHAAELAESDPAAASALLEGIPVTQRQFGRRASILLRWRFGLRDGPAVARPQSASGGDRPPSSSAISRSLRPRSLRSMARLSTACSKECRYCTGLREEPRTTTQPHGRR